MAGETRLLIVAETFKPGWKAGGPVQSLSNLASLLRDSFDIYVLTRDHDHLEKQPYADTPSNVWIERDGVHVYYMDDKTLSYMTLRRVYADVMPHTTYLASIMSELTRRFLALNRGRLIRPSRIVIAPQGEMSSAARSNKPRRKWTYLKVAEILGFFSGVTWHASAVHEADDIRETIHRPHRTSTTPDVAREPPKSLPVRSKKTGVASFVSVARISPIKNVDWMVRLFESVEGEVVLRLVGPREPEYWIEVSRSIARLPPNVTVDYMGPIHPSKVTEVLLASDFFILPTLGEAFGHAIFESLRVGLPVLISDQTPWSVVGTNGAGWVMDTTDSATWIDRIAACVEMESVEYREHSISALHLAQEWYASQDYGRRYRELLGP